MNKPLLLSRYSVVDLYFGKGHFSRLYLHIFLSAIRTNYYENDMCSLKNMKIITGEQQMFDRRNEHPQDKELI